MLNEIGEMFKLKPNSIGPPTQYLGNKVFQFGLEDGARFWAFSSSQYV